MLRNSMIRYGSLAMGFHWAMGVIILGLITVGYVMQHLLSREAAMPLYGWHKSFGILILGLIVLRFGWRLINAVPPLPRDLPALLRLGVGFSHWGLYALMFATPLLGVLMSQSGGHPAAFFGLPLPALIGKDHELHETLEAFHAYAAYTMLGIVVLHIGGALYHRFVLRDGVLQRMLPGAAAPTHDELA